ncbi:uncharacterized protein LOC128961672 [Oppia nitens]|uniref:uncharacterized protein LOC128961672 n=1 Tax=Oppia nitens TaxID=1686743 RepID=UPI0023D9E4E0|nr:uncharacterized protein LOC128961672 [Oppia nitens]
MNQIHRRLVSIIPLMRHKTLNNEWINHKSFKTKSSVITDTMATGISGVNTCETRVLSDCKLDTKATRRMKVLVNPRQDMVDIDGQPKFVDNENQFAFKILNPLCYLDDVLIDDKDVVTNEDFIYNLYHKFVHISPHEYQQSAVIINDLIQILSKLSDRQLLSVLESMTEWPTLYSPFETLFYKVWSNVDQQLVRRLSATNITDNKAVKKFLLFGNMFYKLKVANICQFNDMLVKKMIAPDFELNKISFLHLLFYMNLHRRINPKVTQYVTKQMKILMNDMTLDEISVFCMTFFKTENKLNDDLVVFILNKAINDLSDEINNIGRTAITKCIRRSFHFHFQPLVKQYINRLKQLSNNSEMTLTHVLNLKVTANICDQKLMSDVIDKLLDDPFAFRIKDIERIFLCLSHFMYQIGEQKFKTLTDILDINENIFQLTRHPLCLLNILHYLVILDFYPKSLIRKCFSPEYLERLKKNSKLDYHRHLLLTNTALTIERFDEYMDLIFEPNKVYKYHQWVLNEEIGNVNHLTKRSSLIKQVYMSLKSEFPKKVQLSHVLPFKSYPFVVIWDKDNSNFKITPTTIFKPNMFKDSIIIYLLEINDYSTIDTCMKGSVQLEIRLLKGLGFKVIPMPWHHLTRYVTPKAKSNLLIKEINKVCSK